mmetsp:Transcript_33741/g.93209  ORF Transcript_33741/g.93209 Transcript_33741/m.93209 type:complete len:610 (-) Transcript_33741:63-1892(-)
MIDSDLLQCNLSAFYEDNHVFAPPPPRPLPVVVITGFLGSGKTTLVKRLLGERENLRISAVAHDLASNVNVDAAYIAGSEKALRSAEVATNDGAVVGIGGCACCDDFDKLLRGVVGTALKKGVDKGRLDYLVLETSGAADPRRLIGTLEQRFGALLRARLDRVVAVVDAEQVVAAGADWLPGARGASESNGPARVARLRLDPAEERIQRAQLACADVVLLNKADLVPDGTAGGLAEAEARVHDVAPHARILSCTYGNVPLPELLEVAVVPAHVTPAISHEQAPVAWVVSQDIEPRPRPSANADLKVDMQAGLFSNHTPSHRVVEWSCDGRPLALAGLQEFFGRGLPAWQAHLRRGKGVLWVAEDPGASWEWQLSGRLRYSCRRDRGGFGGVAPRSFLVLIFAMTVKEEALAAVRSALADLAAEPTPPSDIAHAGDQARARVAAARAALDVGGMPGFEVLDDPSGVGDTAATAARHAPGHVLRFRLTGRTTFGIPDDVDLCESPYGIDLDGMNAELARLVTASQGGLFLAIGDGLDQSSGRHVTALLWPLDAGALDERADPPPCTEGSSEPLPPPAAPSLFDAVVAAVRTEAGPLLKRYFAHVQSCQCGQ